MTEFEFNKYFRRNPPLPLPVPPETLYAVIIPVYDELDFFEKTICSIRDARKKVSEKIAIIAVINYPAGKSPEQSVQLLKQLQNGKFPDVSALFLPELSGGVGAARKAGMDAFLATVPPEKISESIIFSLDADTLISENYFSTLIPLVRSHRAVCIGFSHQQAVDAAGQKAIDRYEKYLLRYMNKLKEAGSPYAFCTIGSAFAVRGDLYLHSGGMKVRQAGEDFYFLQNVAKITPPLQLDEVLVYPSARVSDRVPFGTGPAVADLMEGKELNEVPDEAFVLLKNLLSHVRDDELPGDMEKWLSALPEQCSAFLLQEKFQTIWQQIKKNLPRKSGAAVRAFHEWFDGLKTLRFLHFTMKQ